MSARFARVLPFADQANFPGGRFCVERDEDDSTVRIMDETTLPERVHSVAANRRDIHQQLELSTTQVRWLHQALGELLAETDGGS